MHKDKSKNIELFSPLYIQNAFEYFIENLIAQFNKYFFSNLHLAELSNLVLSLLTASCFAMLFYIINIDPSYEVYKNANFFDSRYFLIFPGMTALLLIFEPIFFITKKIFSRFENYFFPILWFVSIFLVAYTLSSFSYKIQFSLALIGLCFVPLSHVALFLLIKKVSISAQLFCFILLEIALILLFRFVVTDNISQFSFWISFPTRYIFPFLMITAYKQLHRNDTSLDWTNLVFNPINIFSPLPISLAKWRVEPKKRFQLKANSLFYFLICFLFIFLLSLLRNPIKEINRSEVVELSVFLKNGFMQYASFFLFSYMTITLPISILQWYGFDLTQAYKLPLLATTPQDRWRRWNTYFYSWYNQFIFVPIYKKTRNLEISIITVFAVTLYIHLGKHNLDFKFDADFFLPSRLFSQKTLFFFSHAIIVILGIRLEKFLPSASSRMSWLNIIFIFILMSFIHGIFNI